MTQFIETIKILNGRIYNIAAHNYRCYITKCHFFSHQKYIDLKKHILIPEKYKKGLVKCRITYSDQIEKIEFESYVSRPIQSLKVIESDNLDYNYKWSDRSSIHELFDQRGASDDILIIKNGLITDTFYANVALWNGNRWHTPQAPLLLGTQRDRLLRLNKIQEQHIEIQNLSRYTHLCIFNAMIAWKSKIITVDHIIL